MNEDIVVEYHKLRPRQLLKRRDELAAAYLPLGILEWHGLHNPLGLDGIKSQALLCSLAKKVGGVVMPTVFWGDHRGAICELVFDPSVSKWLPEGTGDHATAIAREMGLAKEELQADAKRSERNGGWKLWVGSVVHILFQVESLGFRIIVPYAGHAPQRHPLQEAAERYRDEGGKSEVLILENQVEPKGEDHAAHFETSLMMSLAPDLVKLDELTMGDEHIGVLGQDPLRYATVEFGQRIVDGFERRLREMLAEAEKGNS